MSPASRIFIARHGERIDHIDHAWALTAESPYDAYLTDKGLAQASSLGKHLIDRHVDHIFASPFYRTIQTANQVAKEVKVDIKIEPGLGEFLNPVWFDYAPKLQRIEEIKAKFPAIDSEYVPEFSPKYPETKDDVIVRTAAVVRALSMKYSGTLVLIGHGMTCEFMARGLTISGTRPYISYCSLQTCVLTDPASGRYQIEGDDKPDISFMPEELRPKVHGTR